MSRKFRYSMQQFRSNVIAYAVHENESRDIFASVYSYPYICICIVYMYTYIYYARAVKGLILKKYSRIYGSSKTEEDKSSRMHTCHIASPLLLAEHTRSAFTDVWQKERRGKEDIEKETERGFIHGRVSCYVQMQEFIFWRGESEKENVTDS